MKHSELVGNFGNQIDCKGLIDCLIDQEGDIRGYSKPYNDDLDAKPELKDFKLEIKKYWEEAGYLQSPSVEWINFYPGVHFDKTIVETFSSMVSATPINVWVSSMHPGKCVPWHWDVIDNCIEYRRNPKMVRYSFFIDRPSIGKIFVLNDESYHLIEQGNVYRWKQWDDWHLGFNCGQTQKFLFHYVGILD